MRFGRESIITNRPLDQAEGAMVAEEVSLVAAFGFGVLVGEILDGIYDSPRKPMKETQWRVGRLNGKLDDYKIGFLDLHWFEHYHWGMFSISLSSLLNRLTPVGQPFVGLFLLGIGISLILDENRGGHPFGYGKAHFTQSCIIGALMFAWLLLCLVPMWTSTIL